MKINICASDSSASFFSVRQFLQAIEFQPKTQNDVLTCHLLRPFHGYRERLEEGSLTDTMEVGAQLRFFLSDRILRRFSGFVRNLLEAYEITGMNIFNASALDEESSFFFNILRDVGNVPVCMYSETKLSMKIELDRPEHHIESFIADQDVNSVLQIAEAYLCVGNHWGVIRLLDRLEPTSEVTSPGIARLRAVANVLADRPIEAERYYERWKALGDASDMVKANYGLAMLHLRHHPIYFRNLETAEALLNDAFNVSQILENAPFLSIFNRNGYALVLFRKGQIDEAKSLLNWAVSELDRIPGRVALMHKSVIMYNIAQCHSAQGDYVEALAILNELILIDPSYPEYHMEIARNFVALSDFKKAIDALRVAEACDSTVAEIHNQTGYCNLQLEHLSEATECYKKALQLQPFDLDSLHALTYALSEQNRYNEIIDTLSRRPHLRLDLRLGNELVEQIDIIHAEALSFVESSEKACFFLEERYPVGKRSEEIQDAIHSLTTLDCAS